MLSPYFKDYSLVLIKNDGVVYSSANSGLRPLVECVCKFKGKFRDCILHDKVVGLAAARLIVYSGMISSVITNVSSKSAKELLDKSWIELNAGSVVDNILTKDKLSVCPMELKAMGMDNEPFFLHIKKRFA